MMAICVGNIVLCVLVDWLGFRSLSVQLVIRHNFKLGNGPTRPSPLALVLITWRFSNDADTSVP